MNKMTFNFKDRNSQNIQSLANALANRDNTTINTGTVNPPKTTKKEDSANELFGGLNQLGQFGVNLLKSDIFSKDVLGKDTGSGKPIYEFDENSGKFTSTLPRSSKFDLFNGYSNSNTKDIFPSLPSDNGGLFDGSGLKTGDTLGGLSGGGWLSLGKGLFDGVNKSFNHSDDKEIWGGVGNGIQGFFNVDENDSDVKQGINGALQGAQMGSMFGPWGTAVGAALGLGSSFLDDL